MSPLHYCRPEIDGICISCFAAFPKDAPAGRKVALEAGAALFTAPVIWPAQPLPVPANIPICLHVHLSGITGPPIAPGNDAVAEIHVDVAADLVGFAIHGARGDMALQRHSFGIAQGMVGSRSTGTR